MCPNDRKSNVKGSAKAKNMWLAIMDDGTRITRETGILGAINAHPANLVTLSWIQNGVRYMLDYTRGLMSIGGNRIPWPARVKYEDTKLVAFHRMKNEQQVSLSPSPSPLVSPSPSPEDELLCAGLGVSVRIVGTQRVKRTLLIFPDGSWDWEVTYTHDNTLINAVSGVNYWKIYVNDDQKVYSSGRFDLSEVPDTNILAVLLFFKPNHPAAPRAVLTGFDYYWFDSELFGFSFNDPSFTRGIVKEGVLVSNELWRWVQFCFSRDYFAKDQEHPSPEFE
jgi:hypothetical protein